METSKGHSSNLIRSYPNLTESPKHPPIRSIYAIPPLVGSASCIFTFFLERERERLIVSARAKSIYHILSVAANNLCSLYFLGNSNFPITFPGENNQISQHFLPPCISRRDLTSCRLHPSDRRQKGLCPTTSISSLNPSTRASSAV